MRQTLAASLLIPLLFTGTTSVAGEAPSVGPGRRERMARRENMQENLATVFLFRMQQELQLDRDKALTLFDRVEEARKVKQPLQREFREKMGELRTMVTAANPDEAKVKALTERLMAIRTELHQQDVQFMASLDKLLTPVEKGKFLLFYTGFKKRLGMLAAERGVMQPNSTQRPAGPRSADAPPPQPDVVGDEDELF